MFEVDIPPERRHLPMEKTMAKKAERDCDNYGPHIYGGIGSLHVVNHLDGRNDGKNFLEGEIPKQFRPYNLELVARLEKMEQERKEKESSS